MEGLTFFRINNCTSVFCEKKSVIKISDWLRTDAGVVTDLALAPATLGTGPHTGATRALLSAQAAHI